MKQVGVSTAAAILYLLSGCSSAPDGRQGRGATAELCDSMRSFVAAPLDASGLRRAWFLPFGSYEDGSFDFYAPMASNRSDGPSKAFYERKAGQLTHYLRAPEFAATLASCLTNRHGYLRLCQLITETTFRASFRQTSSGRSVEIAAAEKTTSVLIAEGTWKGNLEQALTFGSDDKAAPDKSTQPVCKDARS
jgi:hypothetical protein